MRLRTRLLTGAAAVGALIVPLAPGAPVAAEVSTPEIDLAVDWLLDQQQADGGFEVSGFAGFETPDAIFALASQAQTPGQPWSTAAALEAVDGLTSPASGTNDPLDAVDDWVDGVQGGPGTAVAEASQAAKVIVLVTAPLGIPATDVDPSGDSEAPVDLVAALQAGAGPNLDYAGAEFAGKVFVVWAHAALGLPVPQALLDVVVGAQQANGGFNYFGDPAGTGFDPDIAAAVVIALTEAGVPTSSPVIQRALTGLAFQQRWDGEWAGEFDDGNPNSTAMVMLAAAALGSDPATSCWRDRNEPRMVGVPYPSPEAAIVRAQADDGHITSPSDAFGANTFATSQSIQALAAAQGVAFYRSATTCTAPTASAHLRTAQALYVDLLGRVSEPGGAEYWASKLASGMTTGQVARRISGTGDYRRAVVTRLTQAYLGRPATVSEQAAGAPAVAAGKRFDLAAAILGGDAYYESTKPSFPEGAPATPTTWVTAVYPDALGRPATGAEITYWTGRLADGQTRAQVARSLLLSQEGRYHFVQETYHQLLRREGSTADLRYWGGRLQTGTSPELVVILVVGSKEYRVGTQAPS